MSFIHPSSDIADCKIGAGFVVVKDVPDYAVVVGNPGKVIRYIQK